MEYIFKKALPIWAENREKEMNCELAFRMLWYNEMPTQISENRAVMLALAASTIYRVWINGSFVAAGPARAAHDFYRVDELDITGFLNKAENVIVIEVVGYNINTYDTLDQPSFLRAEVLQNGIPVIYTGDENVNIYDLHKRIQKVQRYSFQRAFSEAYELSANKQTFYTESGADYDWGKFGILLQTQGIQTEKVCITRDVRMPEFETLNISGWVEIGNADYTYRCPNLRKDRSYLNIGDTLKGFMPKELKEQLSDEGQNIFWTPVKKQVNMPALKEVLPLELKDGYGLFAFPYNATGFPRLKIECSSPCVIYLMFDEILSDEELDFLRLQTCNCFKYKLDAGVHEIMTFAPYTMKFVKIAAKGSCTLTDIKMVEYKHPQVTNEIQFCDKKDWMNDSLEAIYRAALETYRANAVDAFMDCPSRERAGWLCDSFFTSRVEYALTGDTKIERAFLDNFIMAKEFPHLPKGMLPMCYPADHPDGNFIPNWAMWFVVELEEYYKRSKDAELICRAKERVYDLIHYFERFENEFGLLEKLEQWVFIEWSRANDADVVQDVNFPSNMLYTKMLQTAAKLYADNSLSEKAESLKKVIRERSFRNGFYTDNEIRTPEGLMNPGNCTEVCQYYAFFTGVANTHEDKALWEVLVKDFGPWRKQTKMYPEVAFANAFIGNYLRIELLYLDKKYEDVLENICGYFNNMAKRTGTLWEFDSTIASCNHGFAAHVIYWLHEINKKKEEC